MLGNNRPRTRNRVGNSNAQQLAPVEQARRESDHRRDRYRRRAHGPSSAAASG